MVRVREILSRMVEGERIELPQLMKRAEIVPDQLDAVDALRVLQQGGMAVGLHGKTHTPMTSAPDLDLELSGARAEMAARMPYCEAPQTVSFPHGRFDAAIAQRARQAGYELVFTSVPVVNPIGSGVGWLLGRLGFENDTVADRQGRFRPDLLALYLFRRPGRMLA